MDNLVLENLTDQVRNLLQRVIEAGQIAPGTRIHEEEFAKKLGISKSPLRVALHQLKQDGIIRIEPRKGIYVAMPRYKELLELLEVREVLEGLATRRATINADDRFVRRLEACFAGFDKQNLDAKRLEYAAADFRFQRLIVEVSGSSELMKTLKNVNVRIHMSRLFANHTGHHDLAPYHQEHLGMIDAIKARDSVKAEAIAISHVERVRKQFVLTTHDISGDGQEQQLPTREKREFTELVAG